MHVLKGVSRFPPFCPHALIPPKFLERDPAKRLACKSGDGFEEFRRHPWFQPIDWEALENKELPPPFTPDVRCPLPTNYLAHSSQSKKANFDASHELEELLLEDNPLKAKQRKPRDVNSLSVEMRQMEEQYGFVLSQSVLPSLFLDSLLTTSKRCSVGPIIRTISK